MVDWDRLERELDGAWSFPAGRPAVRRLLPLAVAAIVVVGAVAAAAVVVLSRHPGSVPKTPSRPVPPVAGKIPPTTAAAPAGTRAAIYAAVLSGGSAARPLRRPVWVRSAVCAAVPAGPSAADCAGAPIPAEVRRQVVAILGTNVQFAADPPAPSGPGDAPVFQFGRLTLRGDAARVGVETRCGPRCGEGETLRLQFVDAAWRVVGTAGTEWVS